MAKAHAMALIDKIQMGVNLHHMYGSMFAEGIDAGNVDGVIAAKHDGQRTCRENFSHAQFDVGVTLHCVGVDDVGIADIHHANCLQVSDVILMVIGAGVAEGEKRGGFADGAGPEAGAGTPLRAKIVRSAHDRDVGCDIVPVQRDRRFTEGADPYKRQIKPSRLVSMARHWVPWRWFWSVFDRPFLYDEKYLYVTRHNDKLQRMIHQLAKTPFSPTDLRLLRIFQAVVRHEGFAAAQNELGISPGTISNHIAQLEGRFGVRLCERGRKGFSLTDEGVRIHEAAENLLRSIENFSGIVGSVRGELSGTVHFGTVDAMYTNTDLQLQNALAKFNERAPHVQIHLEIASPQDLLQRLLDGRYSLILTPIDDAHPSVRAIRLFEERQSLFCGALHYLFKTPDLDLTPDRLQQSPYAARTYMKENAGPANFPFSNAAQASHMESLAILILSGRYIGYLPDHFAQPFVARGEMKSLLPDETSYFDTFYLAHRRDEKSRAMTLLFACLSSFAKGPVT